MARNYGEYLRRGATIAAVVIDAPGQNAAMVEKLALPFPVLADPDGERAIKPFGVWDEAGKMARPAIVVIAPDGQEAHRYVGVDFMDRPNDDATLAAVAGLGLGPLDIPLETVPHTVPAPGPRAMTVADLAVYLRGVRSAMQAMAGRARDPFDKAEAERSRAMAERFIAAQGATLRLASADR